VQSLEKEFMTPNEVAELLLVKPITVRKWAQSGELKASLTPGGHRRFHLRDIDEFASRKGVDLHLLRLTEPRILIVDDDALISTYLADLIQCENESAKTHVVKDGFEAGLKVLEFKPSIILLDIMLPGINGCEVCRNVKSRRDTRDIRVIAMTGYYSQENIKNIISAGAETCLKKPVDKSILLPLLNC